VYVCVCVKIWLGGDETERNAEMNEMTLIREMNVVRRSGILLIFNVRFCIMYVLERLAVGNDVHWTTLVTFRVLS